MKIKHYVDLNIVNFFLRVYGLVQVVMEGLILLNKDVGLKIV